MLTCCGAAQSDQQFLDEDKIDAGFALICVRSQPACRLSCTQCYVMSALLALHITSIAKPSRSCVCMHAEIKINLACVLRRSHMPKVT